MTAQPHLKLHDGNSIPQVGLGVWQSKDGDEVINAVSHALTHGYRHIDTARIYKNEEGVGVGMKKSGVARDDVFLTTKIWNDDVRQGRTLEALDESLARLGTDYVDLLLIHWPVDGRVEAWRAFIDAQKAGKVKSIGVSNFLADHLEEIVSDSGVAPVINQIEHHPTLTQPEVRAACDKHNVVVQAWSPLMQGKFKDVALLEDIGKAHDESAAQVALRWGLQRDVVILPKSVNAGRIEQNFALFDFELSGDEMEKLNALDTGARIGPDPANFNF